jgi:hypothetical protein
VFLNGEPVASERPGVGRGGEAGAATEGGDDECGLVGPPAVDGGSADVGPRGDPVDGEAAVALLAEDGQCGVEDDVVVALVARPARPSLLGGFVDGHDKYVTPPCSIRRGGS